MQTVISQDEMDLNQCNRYYADMMLADEFTSFKWKCYKREHRDAGLRANSTLPYHCLNTSTMVKDRVKQDCSLAQ